MERRTLYLHAGPPGAVPLAVLRQRQHVAVPPSLQEGNAVSLGLCKGMSTHLTYIAHRCEWPYAACHGFVCKKGIKHHLLCLEKHVKKRQPCAGELH